jgi:hypothetical protein
MIELSIESGNLLERRSQMIPNFTELDVSYYSVPIYEEDTFDFSLFETTPIPTTPAFDSDTIELLDRDKFATGG